MEKDTTKIVFPSYHFHGMILILYKSDNFDSISDSIFSLSLFLKNEYEIVYH
jgi:hypothetical protein